MFTGIVAKKIKVSSIKKLNLPTGKQEIALEVYFDTPNKIFLEEGESVSLNGICSTVVRLSSPAGSANGGQVKHNKQFFQIHFMKETLDNTKVGKLKAGDFVNFEQSLKWNDKVSGHFVSGHIDYVGKVISIEKKKGWVLRISIPTKLLKYVALKGSITIDGVSLTVSKVGRKYPACQQTWFEVSLIPYTIEHTTLGSLSKGNLVNIETDLLAKYAINKK